MNCEHCQPLLLDHLYGLLDRDEAAQVDAHLALCPACTDARTEMGHVQGLFARAAKAAFPNTRFEPPAPAQKSEPRTPSHDRRRPALPGREGKGWRVAAAVPWLVAAAVLVAVPGTVVPVLDVFHKAAEADREAAVAKREADGATLTTAAARQARDARLTDAQVKLAAAEQTRVALFDKWLDEQKAVAQSASARRLTINVLKPATIQPGAPNDFLVVLRDEREGSARRSRLVAEVRASDAVLFTQSLDHEKRGHEHPIRLPASVWTKVKPDAELMLVVAEVDEKTQARTAIQEVRLAGPVFTTLLVTDKPTYQPGERLFFRSLTLDRVTLKPPAHEQTLRYDLLAGANLNTRSAPLATATGTTGLVRVGDGAGRVEPVRTVDGQPVRGVGCGEFVLPADLADGEYTLVLRELPTNTSALVMLPVPVTRTVKVRSGTQDAYAKQIGFAGASFVSGDTVEAWAELKLQDRPVAGAEIVGVAVEADHMPIHGIVAAPKTDNEGRAKVLFALPAEVLNGDVRLKVTFRTGAGVESVADRVPVIGRRLLVEFFPEGGDALVAGVPCKVYVRATTPAGQPVDISGVVTDGRQTLATVKTLRDESERGANRGLASFTFVPEAGVRTWLKLDAPNGVYAPILVDAPVKVSEVAALGGVAAVARRTGFALPDAQLDGVVMSVPDTVTAPGQPIRVHLHSVGQPRTFVVGAYVRGRLADTQRVRADAGQLTEVKLMAGADPRGGVVRVTAFEEVDAKNDPDRPDLKPVAERLVFRRPGEVLNLALAATTPASGVRTRAAFAPGTPMTCAVTATDEKNNPVAAVLWAAVVNTGVAPGAKDRALPTHFLLAGDVKSPEDLEFADFLLTDHPKAHEALDLVLGTQGWRRFAEQGRLPLAGGKQLPQANYGNYTNGASAELARLMMQNGQYIVQAEPVAARDSRRVACTYAPLYEESVQAVAKAQAALDQTRDQARDTSAIQNAQVAEEAAQRVAAEQLTRAGVAREPVRRFRSGVWFGVAGFAALALLCGGVSLARPRTRLPLGFSTVGSFGLAAFLFVAAGWGDEALGGERATAAKVAEPMSHDALTEQQATGLAPAPRLALGKDTRAGSSVKSSPVPGAIAESKTDNIGGRMPGGFGAAAGGGGGSPSLTMTKGGPPGPPLGRGPDPKVAMAPNAPYPAGPAGLPAPPSAADMTKPLAVAPGMPGTTGWEPKREYGVTAGDLARSRPSDATFGGYALRSANDERAATLRKVTADVNKFASDRQRALTESLEAQYAGRGAAKAGGPENVPVQGANGALVNPAKVEEFALQQMRGTVTALPPLIVREYASPRPAIQAEVTESQDTILWQPLIVLPADGKAVLNFTLGNAPGGYRVVVAGHTTDGRLGEARTTIAVAPTTLRTVAPAVTAPPGGPVPQAVPTAPAPQP